MAPVLMAPAVGAFVAVASSVPLSFLAPVRALNGLVDELHRRGESRGLWPWSASPSSSPSALCVGEVLDALLADGLVKRLLYLPFSNLSGLHTDPVCVRHEAAVAPAPHHLF